ncbi:hypothetical protein HPP92_013027 [Vanilla planifolia]|uniref:RING-type E3 ubiquitin transferase n=1 Tax=Vanilla planifolia TaxID=51239 RepID=A0A835UY85_VANPL|nr:hypothetical protein HPP92_013027 [Vanilla planifolia]
MAICRQPYGSVPSPAMACPHISAPFRACRRGFGRLRGGAQRKRSYFQKQQRAKRSASALHILPLTMASSWINPFTLTVGVRTNRGRGLSSDHGNGTEVRGSARGVVAVAINAGKGRQEALEWALDNVVAKGQVVVILHFRKKITAIPTPSWMVVPTFVSKNSLDSVVNLIIGWKELDLEIRRLKLQLKQSVNLFQATSTENNYRKVDEKLQKQEPAKENWQADAFIEVSKAVSAFRRYFVGEIEKATDNFSNERKVADGGLGHVFKSALDHNAVVIKIFRSDFVQSEDLFQMEFGANLHVKGFLLPCFRFLHLTQILGGKIEWPLPPKRDKLPWCLL